MAGRDLPSLAFAFARHIQRESSRFSRTCRFPRTHRQRTARRRHGLGVSSGPRRRFFARNHRQNHHRGYARQGNRPLRGQAPTVHRAGPSAPATAANQGVPAQYHVGPSAPASLPPSTFTIPPMDCLLAGPSAPFLGEEEVFPCELAPPPLPPYCLEHRFGPCPARTGTQTRLPSSTPSDELPEHFLPPGYGPVPDLLSPTPAAAETGGYPTIPDLNIKIKVEEEEMEGLDSSSTPPPPSPATPPPPPAPPLPPTPPPEARRILCQFATAMAQNRAAIRGVWSPDALGLTGNPGVSGSGEGLATARGRPRFP